MNERQILVIKHSWSYILLQSEKVGALFYRNLFTEDPTLKPVFHNNMAAQTRKFTTMMTFLVTRLQYPDELKEEIQGLARRHAQYGVKSVDYDSVGKVLLTTLARVLKERWTPETQTAWQKLYQTLASAMQESFSRSAPQR